MPILSRLRILVNLFFIALAVGVEAHAGDGWTRFQGPVDESLAVADVPLRWSSTQNVAWRTPLVGYGQSSPVVWQGRVFVTSISGAMKENCHVAAYDLQSGKVLWQHDLAAASQAENSTYVSKAAPSPVVDEAGVTALFEGGNLISLTHDGKVRWQRNLVAEYGAIDSRHGLGASLEQDAERIYGWIERSEAPYVLALSKSTGETIWKQEGLGVTSWSSPRLVPIGEANHLVLSGIGRLAGLDPRTGQRLWSFEDISGNSTPTPVPLGEGRFLIGATTGNGDANAGKAAASNGVVQIKRQADGAFSAEWVWRAERATSSFGSPIAHRGYAYFVNRAGVVYCLDLESGEEQYAKRSSGSIWATPIGIGERIYLFGKEGTTTVIQAGPDFEVLAENELAPEAQPQSDGGREAAAAGATFYAAVAVEGRFLIRSGEALYAIGQAESLR
ncbi:outer membrane protein assembly factor BamB family protein [Candidatus Laterigemmans baculatus]|uniref:outer membrane protein assembly factor BamB family protein n=1 Tax=Candidatus Laterigemmans baculatus TaxID=2770505 RepID=UPI0013DC05F4|nr:PQQ-binding-like beta-propeller repeat protein [Candidatus Laterigemmans baculatus]